MRKLISVLLSSCLILTTALGMLSFHALAVEAPIELIQNGDFEGYAVNTELPRATNSSGLIDSSNRDQWIGHHSGKHTVVAESDGNQYVSSYHNLYYGLEGKLEANKTYEISLRLRTASDTNTNAFAVFFVPGDDLNGYSNRYPLNSGLQIAKSKINTEWQTFTFSYTVTKDSLRVGSDVLRLYCNGNTLHIDDVSVVCKTDTETVSPDFIQDFENFNTAYTTGAVVDYSDSTDAATAAHGKVMQISPDADSSVSAEKTKRFLINPDGTATLKELGYAADDIVYLAFDYRMWGTTSKIALRYRPSQSNTKPSGLSGNDLVTNQFFAVSETTVPTKWTRHVVKLTMKDAETYLSVGICVTNETGPGTTATVEFDNVCLFRTTEIPVKNLQNATIAPVTDPDAAYYGGSVGDKYSLSAARINDLFSFTVDTNDADAIVAYGGEVLTPNPKGEYTIRVSEGAELVVAPSSELPQFQSNAIRTTGNQALRYKFTVSDAMLEADYDGYQIVEYGYLAAQQSRVTGEVNHQSTSLVASAYERAYGGEITKDVVFARDEENGERTVSVALYNIGYNKTYQTTDYAVYDEPFIVRSYTKFENADGVSYLLYGDAYSASVFATMDVILSETESTEQVQKDQQSVTAMLQGKKEMLDQFISVYPDHGDALCHTITVTAENGTAYAGATYAVDGEEVQFICLPDANTYGFLGWYDGETQVSAQEAFSLQASDDINLVAKYEIKDPIADTAEGEELYAALVTNGTHQPFFDRSIVNAGNTALLVQAIRAAQSSGSMNVVALGGSITQGAKATTEAQRYANLVASHLEEQLEISVNFTNAGIGSTSSVLGVARMGEQVLSYEPDLVLLDFTTNDQADTFYSYSYEAILKTCLEKGVAVVAILYGHNDSSKWSNNQIAVEAEGGGNQRDLHLPSLLYYDIPTIDFYGTLWDYYLDADDSGIVEETNTIQWADLWADYIHPNTAGHRLAANAICNLLDGAIQLAEDATYANPAYEVPDSLFFAGTESFMGMTMYEYDTIPAELIELTDGVIYGDYENVDSSLTSQWNPWVIPAGDSITLKVPNAKCVAFWRVVGPATGTAEIYVNGRLVATDTTTRTSNLNWMNHIYFGGGTGMMEVKILSTSTENPYYVTTALIAQAD